LPFWHHIPSQPNHENVPETPGVGRRSSNNIPGGGLSSILNRLNFILTPKSVQTVEETPGAIIVKRQLQNVQGTKNSPVVSQMNSAAILTKPSEPEGEYLDDVPTAPNSARMQSIYPKTSANFPRMQSMYPKTSADFPRVQSTYPKTSVNIPEMQSRYPITGVRYPERQSDMLRSQQRQYWPYYQQYPNVPYPFYNSYGGTVPNVGSYQKPNQFPANHGTEPLDESGNDPNVVSDRNPNQLSKNQETKNGSKSKSKPKKSKSKSKKSEPVPDSSESQNNATEDSVYSPLNPKQLAKILDYAWSVGVDDEYLRQIIEVGAEFHHYFYTFN